MWRNTTLTILSGATVSEELNLADQGARRIKNLTLSMPAGPFTGVITVYTAKQIGGTYTPLNDGYGNDFNLLAGKSQQLIGLSAGAIKLVSTLAEGADRVIGVQGAVQK